MSSPPSAVSASTVIESIGLRAEDRDLAIRRHRLRLDHAAGGSAGTALGERSAAVPFDIGMAHSALARRLRRLPIATVLGREVPVATGFSARLLGLAYLELRARPAPAC